MSACCPICLNVQTLKVAKYSEHLGLCNAYDLFLPLPLMLPSNKPIDLQFSFASFLVYTPGKRGIEWFPTNRMLEVFGRSIL